MNPKPTIFISHLSEEKEVPIALKSLLEDHLGNQVTVFVSSDDDSIRVGERWLDSVSRHLKSCVTIIVMCSPAAIHRHWLHFEAGAGWIRDILVIPVCYGGLRSADLPDPLRQLQAVDADDDQAVARLIRTIGKTVEAKVTRLRCTKFVELVTQWRSSRPAVTPVARFFAISADVQNELAELIQCATQNLILCGNHFNISLTNRHPLYLDALARGLTVTFSVLAPGHPAIATTAELTGTDRDVLEGACAQSQRLLQRLRNDYLTLPASTRGRLVIRHGPTQMPARAYVFDEALPTGKLLYCPYVRGCEPTQSPIILFPSGHLVYSTYLNSILRTVSDSQLIYDSQSESHPTT